MESKVINILGANYEINFNLESEEADGEAQVYRKTIKIRPVEKMLDNNCTLKEKQERQKEVIRHELFHSVLYEVGEDEYSRDERLVNLLAILSPKIFEVFQELDIL